MKSEIKVNIPAGETLYIWLNYDIQLTRENAIYAYTTNIFPYEPVSKLSVSVSIEESRNIDAKKTSVYWESDGQPEDQRFARNQENAFDLNKESVSKWIFSFEKESIGLEEWKDNLKIEYDVERLDNTCGDIVMRDGHFIHYIAPKQLSTIPKNVILTIDTTAAMEGERLNNVKEALITILDTLTDQDTFWVQEFMAWTSPHWSKPVQATPRNRESAYWWVVNRLSPSSQSKSTFDGILKSVQQPIDDNRANVAFIISGSKMNWDASAQWLKEWPYIQASILDANSIKNNKGEVTGQKWGLYNFNVGGAPQSELHKLSNLNMGVAHTSVHRLSEIKAELTSFYNKYSIPVIWNNQFHYNGASEYDCSDINLYEGQEMTCIGKLPSSKECGDIEDLGFTPGNTLLAGANITDVSRYFIYCSLKFVDLISRIFLIIYFSLALAKLLTMLNVLLEAMLLLFTTALTQWPTHIPKHPNQILLRFLPTNKCNVN